MERKTPLRAGAPALRTHPLGWVSVVRVACRCAVAYALRLWLGGFFLACWFLHLNIFHAKGLAPSGGHILSSPAKKEYGKKDAAQGGVFPALRTHPLGWVSVVRVAWYGLPDKLASASVPW